MEMTDDVRVADAMNRVLEAERAARAAIADCELRMQASLEQARQVRRSILERAQQRIAALHTRAARSLEPRTARVLGQHEPPDFASARVVDSAQLRAAIEGLIERITGAARDEF
jgi:hypothetical protein